VAVLLKTYICIVCWTRTILLVAEFFFLAFFYLPVNVARQSQKNLDKARFRTVSGRTPRRPKPMDHPPARLVAEKRFSSKFCG
jgi:hypothetical protein